MHADVAKAGVLAQFGQLLLPVGPQALIGAAGADGQVEHAIELALDLGDVDVDDTLLRMGRGWQGKQHRQRHGGNRVLHGVFSPDVGEGQMGVRCACARNAFGVQPKSSLNSLLKYETWL